MTDTHFVITVPRFAGYKTLFLNGIFILFGVLTLIYPQFIAPDAATVGAFYDTATGLVAMIIGVVNVILRLVTTSPAGPMKPKDEASSPPTQTLGFVDTVDLERALRAPAVVQMRNMDVAHDYESWRQPMRTDNLSVADAVALDAVASELASAGLNGQRMPAPIARRWSAMRGLIVALVMPSLILAGAVGTATLGGCATAKEVNAVLAAESVEQKAFALYGTFVVLEERAAELVRDISIPKAIRKRIQAADRVAKPLADRVRGLAVALNAARTALNTGQGAPDRVSAAVEALTGALAAFKPALDGMTTAVAAARG